jgi:SAM-dependent methyltransferase
VDSENDRYASAQRTLGTVGSARRAVSARESVAANIAWWDADAEDYLASHSDLLGEADFLWCPEGLRERDLGLLGDVTDKDILEVGCGSAPCARWLTSQGSRATAIDLSAGMLRHAAHLNDVTGITPNLVRANAEQLPFAPSSFDIACSAFGAVPFVADVRPVFAEVARVLRPDGRWVFAVTHPMRWIFPDDPGPAGLTVITSYFDRTPYLEVDADGNPTYVEHHRTLGDYVRALTSSGFVIEDLIEPEWPEEFTREWGQWSPLRGELFPGTVIFCCRRAA